MKRRGFIKKAAAATTGAIIAPYILPSGRLFAATGAQLAQHVVMVMFAGGVRQQESVEQTYLDQSQGIPIQGTSCPTCLMARLQPKKLFTERMGILLETRQFRPFSVQPYNNRERFFVK